MVGLFNTVLEMSVKGAVVITSVMLLRLILYKAPKRYSYFLWAIPLFRLCCPFGIRSVLSVFSLISPSSPTLPNVSGDIIVESGSRFGTTVGSDEFISDGKITVEFVERLEFVEIFNTAVMIIWFIGMTVALCYTFISYFKLKKRMSNAIRYEGNIYMSELVGSPFALGFIKPRIYIPFGLDDTTREQIIAHEKCHLRRLDHIIKPFAFLVLAVHWFNPFCWVAFRLMSLDMEMSCDEKVLKIRGDELMKKNYTRALLSFATNRRFPAPSPIAFSESGGNAKKRIKHALYWKKPRIIVNILCIILCVCALVACSTDADGYEWKEVKTEAFGENPYNIVYRTNGDGTCVVAEIRIDKDYDGEIHLIIPEKAPNGDAVIAIENAWGLAADETKQNLPIYLTFDDMREITESIKNAKDVSPIETQHGTIGKNNERDAKIFQAFYAEKISDDGKGYYEIEPEMLYEERARLAAILDCYGYDEEACYKDTAAFLDSLRVEEDTKNALAREAFKYLYHSGERVTEISIPASVKYIGYGAFDGCDNLKRVNGITDGCVLIKFASEIGDPNTNVLENGVVINGTPKEQLRSADPEHDANEDFINALG